MVKILPSKAGDAGLVPDQEAKIPRALGPRNQNIKQKQYCNKFNKDFKDGLHQKTKNDTNKGHCFFLCGEGDFIDIIA